MLKFLIKFRYRVNIKWLELLDEKKANLILPTHVALIDPVIMFAFLWNKKALNPVELKLISLDKKTKYSR